MPTDAEIRAGLEQADQLAIQPAQMVALLDRGIAAAVLHGAPTVSYQIAGRSRQIGLSEARELRAYYASLGGSTGGVVSQLVEFS